MNKKLFLSAVSSEFECYRKLLAGDLKRPTLDVAVQEDFVVTDGTTLQKLDTYIQACDGVVHLIGKAVGAIPETVAVQALLEKYPDLPTKLPPLADALAQPDPQFSYTQWEAYLAIYHGRPIFVYRPTDFDLAICQCPREDRFVHDAAQEQAQREHYSRICALGRDRGQFLNAERLSSAVLRDLVEILPALERRIDVPPTRLSHTAEQLVGREHELTVLDDAWNNPRINVVVVRGKGGEGKTSLVATWMAELAFKNWRGAERVIDWSFYSQGTRDQTAATAEFFINRALIDLGDPDPTLGSPDERATRLVKLINERRTLLVLDGLEPLQYPPGSMHGALKDAGMATLLRGLVAQNTGLVVVTTREKVTEIQQHYGRSAIDHDLTFLSPLAGAQVLFNAGATRAGAATIAADDQELQQASEEVHGHALTLFLVGQYLRLTENGDIRRRDTLRLADADHEYVNDATRPYGHAFKSIEAYEKWFESGDDDARLQLSVLRMLGLFDRPASAGCLDAIRTAEIVGLSEVWKQRSDRDWRKALARLVEIKLIEQSDNGTVDAHPLIREYFAESLKGELRSVNDGVSNFTLPTSPFVEAHSRLFDYLCETTPHRPDGLDGLAPLYEAVTHGCLAERHQETCVNVYRDRILRGTGSDGFYSTRKLGAIGADLAAVAAFFVPSSSGPWSQVSPNLTAADQAWLLNEAATRLRALGRLTKALEPMRAGMKMLVQQIDWRNAAQSASNLSELELALGRLPDAVTDARQSITHADQSGDAFMRMMCRTTAADALHQSGQRSEAGTLFAEAERMQQEWQPQFDLLYSLRGFRCCDWLLAPAEQAAWQHLLDQPRRTTDFQSVARTDVQDVRRTETLDQPLSNSKSRISEALSDVERRAMTTLKWMIDNEMNLLDIALDHLTLARVGLIRAILESGIGIQPVGFGTQLQNDSDRLEADSKVPTLDLPHVADAVNGLRAAGRSDFLPLGLLTAALYHFVRGEHSLAEKHLAEAQQIAERGPMPLFLADIHLTRARMAGSLKGEGRSVKGEVGSEKEDVSGANEASEIWNIDPQAELAKAAHLIRPLGYGRRYAELADAEEAAKRW
ncbi:MAG: NACHT domain-containing protein [Pirellulaceae bacterium]|nr:NACHT domain-containing protein [Pirellulaceae bacterium]